MCVRMCTHITHVFVHEPICMYTCADMGVVHACGFMSVCMHIPARMCSVCAKGWGIIHAGTQTQVCSPAEMPAPGNKACCLRLLPQAHNCTRKDFEKMYPAFQRFCAIREKLDPTGMFLNAYLEKVFY